MHVFNNGFTGRWEIGNFFTSKVRKRPLNTTPSRRRKAPRSVRLPLARAQCDGHASGHASSARSSVPRSLIERRCARPAAMAAASATTRPVSATQGEPALAPRPRAALVLHSSSCSTQLVCFSSPCGGQPACLTRTRRTSTGSPAPTARCASAQTAAPDMVSATQPTVATTGPARLLAAVMRGGAGPTARAHSPSMVITPPSPQPQPLLQWLRGR